VPSGADPTPHRSRAPVNPVFAPSFEANIPRFFIVRALTNFMLFLPIWVIYVQARHGIDLVEVTLLDSAFWLTMALTEVPTGAVADTAGRKTSYALGVGISAGAVLLFGLATTYPLVLVANSLWAFGLTFVSGADMAFFYDTLRELGRTDEYPKFRGWIAVTDVAATGVSGAVGGVLLGWFPTAPFTVYAGLLALAFVIILTFKEPPRERDADTGLHLTYWQTLGVTYKAVREQHHLRRVLAYSNLLPVAASVIGVTLIQPYAVRMGLPVALLGIIILGVNVVRVAGSSSAGRLSARLGERRLLALAPWVMTAGVVGLGLWNAWPGLVIYPLAAFSVSATRPAIEAIILRETPGSVRATILSVDSLVFRLLLAAFSPLAGWLGEAYSLSAAFVILGIGTAAGLVWVLWGWGPIAPGTELR